ncbi:hypothetical protein MHU86_7716 [Fragilaria crotonensis]|nr:hypothetical protein MHU86_7716 [Fragilaria crotonensis]
MESGTVRTQNLKTLMLFVESSSLRELVATLATSAFIMHAKMSEEKSMDEEESSVERGLQEKKMRTWRDKNRWYSIVTMEKGKTTHVVEIDSMLGGPAYIFRLT